MKSISLAGFKGMTNTYPLVGLDPTYLSELKNCYIDDTNAIMADKVKTSVFLRPFHRQDLANRQVRIENNYVILELKQQWKKTNNLPYTFTFDSKPNYLILDDNLYGWRLFMYGAFGIYGFFNDLKLRKIYNNAVCENTLVEVPLSIIPTELGIRGSVAVFVSNGSLFFLSGNGDITKISGDEYIIQECPKGILFGKHHIILDY